MPKKLDTKFLVNVKSEMEEGYKELRNPIDTICSEIVDLGFSSVRYWMVAQNDIDNKVCFILSRSFGTINLNDKHGKQLPVTGCSIFEKIPLKEFDREKTPTRVYAHDKKKVENNSIINDINIDLNLTSNYYVHIPIRCHGLLHGQVSCSFDEDFEMLDQDYKDCLSILGMMLGDYKLLYAQKKLELAINKFNNEEDKLVRARDSRATLRLITQIIRGLVSAEYATTFDYNWYDGKLISVSEQSIYENETSNQTNPEAFYDNEYLTGKAYHNEKYRYIYNLSELAEDHPELINESSIKKYMRGRKGGSIAYGLIGQREHKCLIRVINKQQNPSVPFDFFERDALEQSCGYFSKAYDDIISYSQLDRMQHLSVSITNKISDIQAICKAVNDSLSDEWVSDMIVFGKLHSEIYATIFYKNTGNNFQVTTQLPSAFIDKCLNSKNLIWIPIEDTEKDSLSRIAEIMTKNKYMGMLVFPNVFENYTGGIGIPLKTTPRQKNGRPLLPELHKSNINAYASMLSRLIWFSRNALASDKAQKLLGTIGHEFKSPTRQISELSSAITESIKETIVKYPEFKNVVYRNLTVKKDNSGTSKVSYEDINYYDYLEIQASKLQMLAQSSRITVDTAALLAVGADNKLELTFEAVNLYLLAQTVADEIKKEINTLQGERNLSCKFIFNTTFSSLPDLICDKYIVEKILENIFRNALKYSIPPGHGKPIEINVNANPQGGLWLNILVLNWGIPINEEDYEKVFIPYNRGNQRSLDKKRARKGMGIGLYIARMFAMSHGGNVSLVRSVKEFGDVSRRDREGGKTEFEIRLSTRLDIGTYLYDVMNSKHTKSGA